MLFKGDLLLSTCTVPVLKFKQYHVITSFSCVDMLFCPRHSHFNVLPSVVVFIFIFKLDFLVQSKTHLLSLSPSTFTRPFGDAWILQCPGTFGNISLFVYHFSIVP